MVVVSCDPEVGCPTFAVYRDGLFADIKQFKGAWVKSLRDWLSGVRPDFLVIEEQYLPVHLGYKTAISRFRSVSALVAARGKIEAIAELCGAKVVRVSPFTWQSIIGGSKLGRERLKQLSCECACNITKHNVFDHNIADAVCIGLWYLRNKG